jgi:hypothetical protein
MQSPISIYNYSYYYLVKELQIKINQLNSHIKKLEDSEISLKAAKKSITSTSTITKN